MIELEKKANALLSKAHADYFAGGAGNEVTLDANTSAFDNLKLLPRVLRGKYNGSFNTSLLGRDLAFPILASPTAFHQLAHTDGELATAQAIAKRQGLMIVSLASNTAIDKITKAAFEHNPDAMFWLQLYIQPDRQFTRQLVNKAENAGCQALVVTVDSPVFGVRKRDHRNGFTELPEGLRCAILQDDAGVTRNIDFDSSLTWNDIDWLNRQTHLPIVLKGILHPQDIKLAIEHGVQAVIVSNHGGRQLDGVPATIEMLPHLAKAAAGKIPLILDSGIRSGTDILKALALGATAVAIGRPVIWGLAVNGQDGVEAVFQQLAEELTHAVQLVGCRDRDDINSDLIYRAGANQ